jgi:hypothetical protein
VANWRFEDAGAYVFIGESRALGSRVRGQLAGDRAQAPARIGVEEDSEVKSE